MSKHGVNNFRNKKVPALRNSKVLVFGLGLLGGGVATTNWLIKHGARVTVTDLKDEKYLEPSLRRLKGEAKLRLNGHDKKDIEENEIVVFNPDVSINNPFVKYARELGKQIENEATIFYKLCPRPIIAITGTRGKTTTTNWTGHFLKGKYKAVISGNSQIEPLLKNLDRVGQFDYVANEIPSYHLEYFDRTVPSPEVAVITNLYQDHLNRHRTMENYALAKAAIFKNQLTSQNLVLNHGNRWTPFFLKQKPLGRVWFFSSEILPKKNDGVFYKNGVIYFQKSGTRKAVIRVGEFVKKWGNHNLENLLASSIAANLAGVPWAKIKNRLNNLPQIQFRQETVFENNRIKIINDTTATSPDGGIAAINRFGGPSTVLIVGGTDPAPVFSAVRQKKGRDWSGASRGLDFKEWARVVKRKIKPENLVLLEGSATEKMIKLLKPYFAKASKGGKISLFNNLEECLKEAIKKSRNFDKSTILFSPAAKSFEKFKNEFDRGQQFNIVLRRLMRRKLKS